MAHQLQAVAALALILCAGAAGAPFSHAVHLNKVKLTCVTCHTAAPSSTKVQDNLLPSPAICAGCHQDDRGKNIKQPRRTLVAKFSHQQHLKLGNIAPVIAKAIDSGTYLDAPRNERALLNTQSRCEACHRGLEQSEQVSAANFPRMADCLVCHNKIEPPYSCETCHVDVKALTPATHNDQWLDTHTNKTVPKEGCAVCHGKRFTCQGCH